MRSEIEAKNGLAWRTTLGGREFEILPLPCRAAIAWMRRFGERAKTGNVADQMELMLDLFLDFARPSAEDREWIEKNVSFPEIMGALEGLMDMANPTPAGQQETTNRDLSGNSENQPGEPGGKTKPEAGPLSGAE